MKVRAERAAHAATPADMQPSGNAFSGSGMNGLSGKRAPATRALKVLCVVPQTIPPLDEQYRSAMPEVDPQIGKVPAHDRIVRHG